MTKLRDAVEKIRTAADSAITKTERRARASKLAAVRAVASAKRNAESKVRESISTAVGELCGR